MKRLLLIVINCVLYSLINFLDGIVTFDLFITKMYLFCLFFLSSIKSINDNVYLQYLFFYTHIFLIIINRFEQVLRMASFAYCAASSNGQNQRAIFDQHEMLFKTVITNISNIVLTNRLYYGIFIDVCQCWEIFYNAQ